MNNGPEVKPEALGRYLPPFSAWALSFGCAVGWGAFIMPGTTFLPLAGPLGTLIGLGIGAAVMFLVGRNYHYLIQNYPEAGGAYGYVKHVCGGDHGYICGWFLILTYVAIAWANATALAPWAFIGFESVSHSAEEFAFPRWRTVCIIIASLVAATAAYAVLTDMWMPELDGEGLVKAIRADAKLAHLPVHVITADVELEENYAEKGFDSIVLKPVTVATVGPILAGIVEKKG